MYKVYGSGKCITGCIGCPFIFVLSFLAGIGKTIIACVTCKCCTEEFLEDREKVCSGCGVSTAATISTQLILDGMADMCTDRHIQSR